MNSARTGTLASLRGSIARIEAPSDAAMPNRIALGHAGAADRRHHVTAMAESEQGKFDPQHVADR